jgi:hypothetical protein
MSITVAEFALNNDDQEISWEGAGPVQSVRPWWLVWNGGRTIGTQDQSAGGCCKEPSSIAPGVYPEFWEWSDNSVDRAILTGQQATVFGWFHRIPDGYNVSKHNPKGDGANPRTLRNFYMQANGAEILRLACILATEAGIRVCAPIHDAVLITAPEGEIEEAAAAMSGYMREASRIVLNGFELRTDLSIVRYPDHYASEKGAAFGGTVSKVLEGLT